MDFVGLGKKEETSDAGVEDLVVIGLSSKSEVGEEHVDVVSSSASGEGKEGGREEGKVRASLDAFYRKRGASVDVAEKEERDSPRREHQNLVEHHDSLPGSSLPNIRPLLDHIMERLSRTNALLSLRLTSRIIVVLPSRPRHMEPHLHQLVDGLDSHLPSSRRRCRSRSRGSDLEGNFRLSCHV